MSDRNPFGRSNQDAKADELLGKLMSSLPFSDEAEKGMLSALIQDPTERMAEARLDVPADAFYHPSNRVVYETLLAFYDANRPIDLILLCEVMVGEGKIDQVGGQAAMSELFTYVPSAAHYRHYKAIVLQKWLARRLLKASAEVQGMVIDHEQAGLQQDDLALVSKAQEVFFAISPQSRTGDGGLEYKEVLGNVVDQVVNQLEHTAIIPENRVPFGFTDLDRRVWGYQRGQLVILAARPSMGKSALAKDIATHVSLGVGQYKEWQGPRWPHQKKKRVLYFNLEMTNEQHGTRDLVGGAGLDLQAMRYGMPVRGAQEALADRMKKIMGCNMRMYDAPGTSIQKMRAICRAQKRKHGLDLVVVDYLQLMHSESSRAKQNRQLEISEISTGLKEMAKELDCVVLALAQLSRTVEERKDKKPTLADLRESGSIEQDADVVMMLLRPAYYFEDAPKDEAWLILAKGRDVGIGEVKLRFDGPKTTFFSTTDSLMSNNEEKRETGYKSKPQASKGSRELDEAFPD